MLDASVAYDALLARDPRFDGVFYVAVTTTGIYCRPICPARTPAKARCEFYASAALAEHAGFRACLRCRPELAPGNADVDAVDALVARAAHRIAEGALNEASIDDLAGELGVTARHLRRVIEARLGVTPVELAQTHRLALAKQLLHDTALPLADIAFASGFGSVRRFNALFRARMGSPPSRLRRTLAPAADGATLRLDARAPHDGARLIAFLAARAIPGVEHVDGDTYRRVVHAGGATGTIAVRANAARAGIVLRLSPALVPVAMPVVARVRRLFDLDARPDVIAAVLGRDRALAPLLRARPGLRVPGALDAFEAAVRALLGQQVSVAAASTLAGRFAARFGTPLADAVDASPGVNDPLRVRFPTAAEVARVSLDAIAAIGLPRTRADAIRTIATALASGRLDLDTPRDLDRAIAELVALPGVGPWTAHYLAMRALHLPDAFPAGDLVLRRALAVDDATIITRAEPWRPFRAYAALHLWTHHAESHP